MAKKHKQWLFDVRLVAENTLLNENLFPYEATNY